MTPSAAPLAIVLSPLLASVLVVLIGLKSVRLTRRLVQAASGISLATSAWVLSRCAAGEVLQYAFGGWAAPYGIVYRVDGLSALMALLISAIAVAVLSFAGRSLETEVPGEETTFLATASLLIAALLGMVVTGDLFNLYVFLEISSIAAYTLIASGGGAASLASFRYLLVGTVGASFYLLGLAFLFSMTGTLNMVDMAERLPAVGDSVALRVAVSFLVAGFGLKMALFPMHAWLPDAYTYAPSTASALIAAVMTKVSAFALLRVLYGTLWPALTPLGLPLLPALGWIGAGAVVAGSVMALAQTDLKRLLAYSSIGQLGYIAIGIALGNRNALIGTMLHIVGHAITKGCLFLIVGGVAYRYGARQISSWHGMHRKMPICMAAFVVAAMSMIGVPPTAGFFSKWYLILGAIDADQIGLAVVLVLSSLLSAWYFFRILEVVYFRPYVAAGDRIPAGPELPRPMLAPIVGLAAMIVLVGAFSQPLVRDVIGEAIDALPGRSQPTLSYAVRGIDATGAAPSAERTWRDGR